MPTSNKTPTVSVRQVLVAALGLSVLAALACGSNDSQQTPAGPADVASVNRATSADTFARFDENLHGWSVVSDEIDLVLATPDLGIGEQRFALVLSDLQGLVKLPVIEFASFRYPNGYSGDREGPLETVLARFNEFPFGTRGTHVATLQFAVPGDWAIEAAVPRSDGSSATAEVRFDVMERPYSISIGEAAPQSRSRTLADVGGIAELTTGSFYDEELYRYSIADALRRDRPLVVVFASPAFCTNAVCGPQVEVASELRERYASDVDFIHVDLFENPSEIQGDLSLAIESQLLEEWRLVSQEWTYVVGADGRVSARFENFVGSVELIRAIESAIVTAQNT